MLFIDLRSIVGWLAIVLYIKRGLNNFEHHIL